ncbi:MAG: hypothetical protein K0V04_45840 [Deltaproteobacteria bacterium]|nr:hypothetical protein [Deltaproteobacteria bacterium]
MLPECFGLGRGWAPWLIAAVLTQAGCSNGGGGQGDEGSTTDAPVEGGDDGRDTDRVPTDGTVRMLEPVEHLVRVSMALRGTRPSVADIERVEADPDAVEAIVDEYLEAPQFGEVIRDLHNDALLVGIDVGFPAVPPLEQWFTGAIGDSVMRAPLRLAEHVVTQDLPYTELVTADYWVVDSRAAAFYGSSYDEGGPQWQVVDIPDERPGAGVLSDNALYLRHQSAGANYNRGRANIVTRALICHDYLTQDIDIGDGIDLSEPENVSDAVTNLPECVACHQSLDPIASHFTGFPTEPDVGDYFDGVVEAGGTPSYPLPQLYAPEAANNWQQTTGRPPGFFGQPTEDLGELGRAIADDPRFSLCTAKRFYAYFNQVRVEDVPLAEAAALQTVLVDSGFDAKALVREVVLGEAFRVAEGLDDETAEQVHGYNKARPFQLALLMDDLTGFRWEVDVALFDASLGQGVISLARTSNVGFGVLGGGLDSQFVTQPAVTVNATTTLLLRTLAAESASFVVERDFAADAGDRRLLVDPSATDEQAVREQLAAMSLRIFGQRVEPDSGSIDEIYEVFAQTLDRTDDIQHAWKTTLTAMLQDLSIIYY